jgi:invasion protein IalB
MKSGNALGLGLAVLAIGATAVAALVKAQDKDAPAVQATPTAVAAWRVECTGDGKVLDCQAIQQLVRQDGQSRQLLAQFSARLAADTKQPVLLMQLPLGINVSEPFQLKVDGGSAERYPLQTCTGTGCFASVPLSDKLVSTMRTGTTLKITVQDTSKRSINIDVPLLGFGLAFDKATR